MNEFVTEDNIDFKEELIKDRAEKLKKLQSDINNLNLSIKNLSSNLGIFLIER